MNRKRDILYELYRNHENKINPQLPNETWEKMIESWMSYYPIDRWNEKRRRKRLINHWLAARKSDERKVKIMKENSCQANNTSHAWLLFLTGVSFHPLDFYNLLYHFLLLNTLLNPFPTLISLGRSWGKIEKRETAVNLSFSFRTPSISWLESGS